MSFDLIGEIGVNHNGDVSLAKELVSFLADAGVGFAKIQVFDPQLLVTSMARLANYQSQNGVSTDNQFEMLSALSLTRDEVFELDEYATANGIALLATPFDTSSLRFLLEDIGHQWIKISSGDITFVRLLWEAARSSAQLLVSTGMSTLDEVEEAAKVIRFGRAQRRGVIPNDLIPTAVNLQRYRDQIVSLTREDVQLTLFHCTSSYPAPAEELNISALKELERFDALLGYSDHSLTEVGAVMAYGFGARVFEKHVTLDKELPGPDHNASLEPEEFLHYKRALEEAESVFGDGKKAPQASELDVREVARRGIYAAEEIHVGAVLTSQNTVELRPATSLSSSQYFNLLGRTVNQELQPGDEIE